MTNLLAKAVAATAAAAHEVAAAADLEFRGYHHVTVSPAEAIEKIQRAKTVEVFFALERGAEVYDHELGLFPVAKKAAIQTLRTTKAKTVRLLVYHTDGDRNFHVIILAGV
jgi:hypothetical protein